MRFFLKGIFWSGWQPGWPAAKGWKKEDRPINFFGRGFGQKIDKSGFQLPNVHQGCVQCLSDDPEGQIWGSSYFFLGDKFY